MNWIDFLFGALAGASSVLCVGAFIIYRLFRPYIAVASELAKSRKGTRGRVPWSPVRTQSNGALEDEINKPYQ